MELNKIKMNQHNIFGERCGLWETTYGDYLIYKSHFVNDVYFGYFESNDFQIISSTYEKYNITNKCHLIAGEEIGCEIYNNNQWYHNKPGNKFGEQIRWK